MDRLISLQVFRQVAEQGSFAAAGRALGLSAPAISKHIAELEAHLGVRLIQRTTRRMALTDEGSTYLAHITRGLDALSEAEAVLSRTKLTPTGTLRVSAPMTVTLIRLSDAIPAFLSRYPNLKLELHLDDRRVDIVREGFDVAIRGYSTPEDSSLVARRLGVMSYVLCATPGYFHTHGKPKTPSDLIGLDHIRFPHGANAEAWDFRNGNRKERIRIQARYSVTSSLAVRDALRAGFGVSLIPRCYIEDDLQAGHLETALDDWTTLDTTHYAVYPTRRHLAPKIQVFIEFLMDRFQSSL